jgi:hypothetical protein
MPTTKRTTRAPAPTAPRPTPPPPAPSPAHGYVVSFAVPEATPAEVVRAQALVAAVRAFLHTLSRDPSYQWSPDEHARHLAARDALEKLL